MIDFEKIGKYKITGMLGQGSFGVVYRGRDAYLKRDVAIKVCSVEDEGLRKRFFREAEISGKLVHKNIVTVYEFGFEGDIPYLVQEMLSGEDLSGIIKRREPIAPAVKLDYLLQVANGLGYAHTEGVIHRDIKPGNLRRLEDGRVKIMDFGIAKLASAETQLTQKGVTMGTASYLPPEQVRGAELDHRADIFSFGVLAYELLTYQRPFRGNTLSALIYQILYKIPRPMNEVWPESPARLSDLIGKCLEKKSERRYSSFAELIPELDAVRKDILAGRWPTLEAAASPTAGGQAPPGDPAVAPEPEAAGRVAPEAAGRAEPEAAGRAEPSDVLSQAAIAQTARGVLEGKVGDYTISTSVSPEEILHPGRTEPGRSTRPIDAQPATPAPAPDAALKTRVLATTPDLSAPGSAPPATSAPEEAAAGAPSTPPPLEEPEELTVKAREISDLVAQGKLEAAKEQLEATISKKDVTGIGIGISTTVDPELPAEPSADARDLGSAKTRPMHRGQIAEQIADSSKATGAAPAPPDPPPDAARSDTYRTFFRPPLGGLKWAGIAVAAIAAVGLGWLVLSSRDDVAVEPAAEPPPPVAVVQPAVTEPIPLGAVAISAAPWAELTEITDAGGYVVELPQSVHTPLYLELPPGRYKIHLQYSPPSGETQPPEGTEVQTCDLEVTLEAVVSCALMFGEPNVTEYFKETGWWL